MADEFSWDVVEGVPPCAVMVSGPTKAGKSHWSLFQMPEPVYCADTERRNHTVVSKARQAGRVIRHKYCDCLKDVRTVVQVALKEAEGDRPGTFVFDSASDLLSWAEDEYLQQSKADKIYPKVVWARVYKKLDVLIEALKSRGFCVVFLCREKAEYRNDQPTGKVVHEGYKRLPYKSDLVLRLENAKLQVIASGLTRVPPKEISADDSWEILYETLTEKVEA
jgi:hypothetical protein